MLNEKFLQAYCTFKICVNYHARHLVPSSLTTHYKWIFLNHVQFKTKTIPGHLKEQVAFHLLINCTLLVIRGLR